MISLCVIATN